MQVPFVDLKRQYRKLAAEVEKAVQETLSNCAYIMGPEVRAFEEAFAEYSRAAHAVGVANGTDAIEIMIRALNIGPGDEVIIPANTFIASAVGIMRTGASPILVDCDEKHLLLDPGLVPPALTDSCRAILGVHLFGQPVDATSLQLLAQEGELDFLEDACQAHGAEHNGRRAGSLGRAAAFSFYPGKNLGAYGDGGIITTDDEAVGLRCAGIRNYGSHKKYDHQYFGFNSRLDTIQAAVLNIKLKYLDDWTRNRQRAAARYNSLLADIDGVRLPEVMPGNTHVYHLYVIRIANRDRVAEALAERGVSTGIHYPIPVHLHPAMSELGYRKGDFPVAEEAAREILSLPMFPEITSEEIEYVAQSLKELL